mmetsp:Transcript_614/g.1139  ORF Transcript_614/g.1139 Transcript_614/m.1139 type:complete len:187 (+) Transcript_614:154-714(+)
MDRDIRSNNIGDEDNHASAAKRQKLEKEQRSSFEEDTARIRAAAARHADSVDSETKVVMIAPTAPVADEKVPQQSMIPPNRTNFRDDDTSEGEGNWLKNFRSGHTRVGREYQVLDLPSSTTHHAHVIPENSSSGVECCESNNKSNPIDGESDEEDAGNWLKNFTPHHTRVGKEFQVSKLPTPSGTK